ncbi:MAG TPA: alpha/beta fold hydrolase [Thiobacillaceae bacterium]|nr:alpha/beta fold hydrolase [Thiobacillaceae bacterium]HNU62983.1 alpha/beta fold hydrolase [Thiobacillaceae bacterium]
MAKLLSWSLALLLGLAGLSARAETMELTLPNHGVLQADFRPGTPGKPVVLLVHGFLQTHAYPTLHRLADSLAGEGYTVLAPTLSLGIPRRAQSLACEAIHTHALGDGVAELRAWVAWLKARRFANIVLAGHSMGNLYTLSYMTQRPDAAISRLIGISIVEGSLKIGEAARPALLRRLRAQAAGPDRRLVKEQFSFCKEYRAPAADLLSYAEWGPDRILAAIDQVKVPVSMIMGSQDDRLGKDWLARLKRSHARVRIIEGANHFMDGPHEFDLMDLVLAELKDAGR